MWISSRDGIQYVFVFAYLYFNFALFAFLEWFDNNNNNIE